MDRRRLLAIISVVIVLVLALSGGIAAQFYIRYLNQQSDQKQKQADKAAAFSKVVSNTQELADAGKVDESNKAIQNALKDTSLDKAQRGQLLLQQATNYSEQGDQTGAIDSYQQAVNADETYETYKALADAMVGVDNQKAIQYYKRALELLPKDGQLNDAYTRTINQDITILGGQP